MENKAEIIVGMMYGNDWFSQWLGIERVLVSEGKCILRMITRPEMLNGFGILHGGIAFSLADSALAFASNSHGRKSVSVEASMTYTSQAREGEMITATAEEISLSNKIGVYHITVTRDSGEKIALFKGIVYRTGKEWIEM
jgi:acyl-CoA thioesterase